MKNFSFTASSLFSLFFVFSLLAALFYTGNNYWLFSISFISLGITFAITLKQRYSRSLAIPVNGIFISSVLLLSWFAISILPSQVQYLTLYNFFWVGSFLIVFLIFSFSDNKDKIWHSIWPSILLLVLIWACYVLVQYYYLHVPANASFLNRNSLAALVNLALIPAVGYFLLNEAERPFTLLNNKILSLILIILFLTIFIITSRGASLSLLLGLTILIVLLRQHISKAKLYTLVSIIFIAFIFSVLSQYIIPNLPASFSERMVSIQDTKAAGHPRYIIWQSLLPLFKSMPWYGLGLGSLWMFWPPLRPASDTSAGFFAHNDYMQITLEAGYPGIALLITLFIFILVFFIRSLKTKLSTLQRVELVSLFAALTTFAAHSLFTYNFYILPLLIITGLYLARFNQLVSLTSANKKTLPALKTYFSPVLYGISALGIMTLLLGYFLTVSFSSYYNNEAKKLMHKNQYQKASQLFLKAQKLAPLMDNPFFSYADLLRRGADKLIYVKKSQQAATLLNLAYINLDIAERLNPLRPQTHHIRGLIYERKQPELAKKEYRKALKLDPRFLFSRIRLARLLHKEKHLKQALEVLYAGVDYNYPVNNIMLEYMEFFAQLSKKAKAGDFARQLEENIKLFKHSLTRPPS